MIFSIATEIVSLRFGDLRVYKNISWLNLYVIVETVTISVFYYRFFISKLLKTSALILVTTFLLISVYQLFMYESAGINSFAVTFESIMITLFSVLTFHQLLQSGVYANILNAPVFWINSAFIFYFTGNFFLHLFSNYLLQHSQYDFYTLWGLWHSLVNITYLILISIGFWKTRIS